MITATETLIRHAMEARFANFRIFRHGEGVSDNTASIGERARYMVPALSKNWREAGLLLNERLVTADNRWRCRSFIAAFAG